MHSALLRGAALALTIAVVAFVVYASMDRSTGPGAVRAQAVVAPEAASALVPAAARSSASASPVASAAATGNEWGVLGPSTKADPHTVRRAVESLIPSAAPPR